MNDAQDDLAHSPMDMDGNAGNAGPGSSAQAGKSMARAASLQLCQEHAIVFSSSVRPGVTNKP